MLYLDLQRLEVIRCVQETRFSTHDYEGNFSRDSPYIPLALMVVREVSPNW